MVDLFLYDRSACHKNGTPARTITKYHLGADYCNIYLLLKSKGQKRSIAGVLISISEEEFQKRKSETYLVPIEIQVVTAAGEFKKAITFAGLKKIKPLESLSLQKLKSVKLKNFLGEETWKIL